MDLRLRINIELAKPANYIPMGFWVQPVAGDPKRPFYRITDLGIPMVKVADGSALGYSVYVLQVDISNDVIPSVSNPQWRLIESMELIYIQQAFIERLWVEMVEAEGAKIASFDIVKENGKSVLRSDFTLPSIPDTSVYPQTTIIGQTLGSLILREREIYVTEQGCGITNTARISPEKITVWRHVSGGDDFIEIFANGIYKNGNKVL